MVTFKETIQNLSADIRRRKQIEGKAPGILSTFTILFKQGMVSVILYRISRYLLFTRFRFLCKALALIDYFYTRNEISPNAYIGPGVVFSDFGGLGITTVSVVGKNCTFWGLNSITLGAMEGFDVEEQRIVIGDHCVIGWRARVFRPVTLANATQVKNNSIVILSVPKEGSVVSGFPAKRRSVESLDHVTSWNPLYGGKMQEDRK